MSGARRTLTAVGATAIAAFALAAPAAAHIQVRPAEAAPLDPTLWTVLVPNERAVATTRIELKIPDGLVPFSFENAPGWRRSLTYASDKSIDTIVWRGRLAEQELASFSFLGTTPQRQGRLEWKALQTYADGQIVRWIGSPGSEEPASLTTVSKSVPRQNAGGEGGGDEGADAAGGGTSTPAAKSPAAAEDSDGGGSDTLAIALAAAALLAAVAALAVALGVRRSTSENSI